ncbi:MAG: alcohol dehydrogenase, partial [Candidatus Hydrogenedentes bacterium]|nr:alcohol dehydrogenase [Candidatus Hydrogenedentota bacterium]
VQPLFMDPGSVLLGATGNMGTRLLRIEKQEKTWSVKEEWTTRKLRPYFNDFVVHKGHCYGFDGNRLACINAITGKLQWEGKRYGGQLLLMSDMDTLLVLSETGDVILIPATPEGFSEIASFKAISGKTWNHPVVAHGRLFVRNAEEAACFALGTAP